MFKSGFKIIMIIIITIIIMIIIMHKYEFRQYFIPKRFCISESILLYFMDLGYVRNRI